LPETIKETDNIQDKLNTINGSEVDAIEQNFGSCFVINKGLKVMCDISCEFGGSDRLS
jgi:hypothetical protein